MEIIDRKKWLFKPCNCNMCAGLYDLQHETEYNLDMDVIKTSRINLEFFDDRELIDEEIMLQDLKVILGHQLFIKWCKMSCVYLSGDTLKYSQKLNDHNMSIHY